MNFPAKAYEMELDAIEREPQLGDRAAIELLRAEFRRAINASHFIALSADDIDVDVVSRTVPQEGIARYTVTLEYVPRRALAEERAVALVRSEFQRALNAGYFLHAFVEDPSMQIRTRELVEDELPVRWAA